jgi:hypothetical protein
MNWDTIIGSLGALSGFTAAVLWWYASRLEVPDNIDTFIGELRRISRWNSYAAIATGVAALCVAITFGKQLLCLH